MVIPVIAVVMITVRPEPLKIIPVPYLLIPNAVRLVKNAKAVRPEQVHHITERFLRPPNAALVTNAAIPAVPAQQAQAVAPDMKPTMSDRPNAEAPVTPAASILTLTPARAVINPALADQVTQLPAQDLNLVLVGQLPVPAINVPKILIPVIITTILKHQTLAIKDLFVTNSMMNLLAEPAKWPFAEIILILS